MSVITAICPKCQTQYQLQPEQLQVANGKVRCGQCLTVFEAKQAAASLKPAHDQSGLRSSYVRDEQEDLLMRPSRSAGETASADKELRNDFVSSSESLLEDESWLSELLNEDEPSVDSSEDESWAESLLQEEPEQPAVAEPEETQHEEDYEQFEVDLELSAEEEVSLAALSEKGHLRNRIQAEPLEFALASRRSLWLKLLAAFSVLLLCLALIFQLFYFQFDSLSRQPQWRPFYVQACSWLACQLPEKYSIADIRATQLTVKSATNAKNVLDVDMVMLSQAEVPQPFPLFELFFLDHNERVVAASSFEPEEYLLGELKGLAKMPKNQPIHIALKIKDPGKNAGGYKMQLRYP